MRFARLNGRDVVADFGGGAMTSDAGAHRYRRIGRDAGAIERLFVDLFLDAHGQAPQARPPLVHIGRAVVTWPGTRRSRRDVGEDSVTFDLPPTHHFMLEATATSRCRLEASTRQHTVVIDEPAVRGGTDSAATPLETMLASFLACLNVISHLIADEMGVEIADLSMSLDATFDTDGIRNTTPTTLPFPEIALTMNITTSASDAEIAQLREDLGKRCPMTVLLVQAGTKIDATWNVTRP